MDNSTLGSADLTRLLFAISALLAAAHALGWVFERLRMPRVIGELSGGLLLGPTVLGALAPAAQTWLFGAFSGEGKLISLISWIGLALLMFVSGFEIQRSLSRAEGRLVASLLLGATGISFLAGWGVYTVYDFSRYLGAGAQELPFRLVLAIAIAVTSIPVISKIFIDLDITHTWFAKVVIATATVEDVLLWVVLAVATALADGTAVSLLDICSHVLRSLAFLTITLFGLPRLLRVALRPSLNRRRQSSSSGLALLTCFVLAAVASVLQVNLIFGALVAGIAVGAMPEQPFAPARHHIKDFSLAFFVPIYFAAVGLKLDLIHHFELLPFIAFLAFATLVKATGTAFAARLAGQGWRSSIHFGFAMNARGGPGIVVASIALDLRIINVSFFSILVLTALLTSLGAGYWLRRLTVRDPAALLGTAVSEATRLPGTPAPRNS